MSGEQKERRSVRKGIPSMQISCKRGADLPKEDALRRAGTSMKAEARGVAVRVITDFQTASK